MPLLKHGEIVEDGWQRIGDATPLPEGGDVIVPFERLRREFEFLKRHDGRLGVDFSNDRLVDELVPYLGALHLVCLDFPKFADGRGFSLARQIRRQLEFEGELRASGNVLPDQVAFMRQCGLDAFEIGDRFGLDVWRRAATTISLSYQRGYGPRSGFAPAEIPRLRTRGAS